MANPYKSNSKFSDRVGSTNSFTKGLGEEFVQKDAKDLVLVNAEVNWFRRGVRFQVLGSMMTKGFIKKNGPTVQPSPTWDVSTQFWVQLRSLGPPGRGEGTQYQLCLAERFQPQAVGMELTFFEMCERWIVFFSRVFVCFMVFYCCYQLGF